MKSIVRVGILAVFAFLAQGCCDRDASPASRTPASGAAKSPAQPARTPAVDAPPVEEHDAETALPDTEEPVVFEDVDVAALEAEIRKEAAETAVHGTRPAVQESASATGHAERPQPPLDARAAPETPKPPVEAVAVRPGDTVYVLYVGTLDDGTVFDASERHGNVPLEFVAGSGRVIAGFDRGVLGMKVGEKKSIHIPAEDAYGPRFLDFPRDFFPAGTRLLVGGRVALKRNDGGSETFVVERVGEETVTLARTHPLAGKDLNFDIQVVKIQRAE